MSTPTEGAEREQIARIVRQAMHDNPTEGSFGDRAQARSIIADQAADAIRGLFGVAPTRPECADLSQAILDLDEAHSVMERGDARNLVDRAIVALRAAVGGGEPIGYLHTHPQWGRELDFMAITDGDRRAGWDETSLYAALATSPERVALPSKQALIDIIMRQTTDNILADGWERLGDPNVLVQGCKFIRRGARTNPTDGYADPDDAAQQFAGFIADGILAALSASPGLKTWRPQPIETAPRDDDEILLVSFQNQGPGDLVYISMNNGCWDETQRCFVLGPRGCVTNDIGDGHSTHWLPRGWLNSPSLSRQNGVDEAS